MLLISLNVLTMPRNVYHIDNASNEKCCYSYQPMALLWVEGAYLLNNRSTLLFGYRKVKSRKDERLREGQLVARAAVVAAGVGKETLEKGMEKGIEKRMEKARVEAVAVVGTAAQAAAA
jgi:hypothetical protein